MHSIYLLISSKMKKHYIISLLFILIGLSTIVNAQVSDWQWVQSADGSADDYGNCISTDISGNVFVAGRFNSPTITFGTTTLTNAGGVDIFIVKYDNLGNVLWAKSAGGSSYDEGIGIKVDANGNS